MLKVLPSHDNTTICGAMTCARAISAEAIDAGATSVAVTCARTVRSGVACARGGSSGGARTAPCRIATNQR